MVESLFGDICLVKSLFGDLFGDICLVESLFGDICLVESLFGDLFGNISLRSLWTISKLSKLNFETQN